MPPKVYLGLKNERSDEPTIQDEGYERQIVEFSPPVQGKASNLNPITFAAATYDWGVISSFHVFGAPSGGEPILSGYLENGKFRVRLGSLVSFPASAISITAESSPFREMCETCRVFGSEGCTREDHRPPPAPIRTAWNHLLDEDE